MRWTDLPADAPGDKGSTDGGPSGPRSELRRTQWQALRQRLETLSPGHPSWPGGDQGDSDQVNSDQVNSDQGDEAPADEIPADEIPVAARPGGLGDHWPHPAAAAAGRREPYRPWFAPGGKAPQPWFAVPGDDGFFAGEH